MLTFGSLFAGIGGFDLGLERAGLRCKWQVENDPTCVAVLTKHWPGVKKYGDITKVNFKKVEKVQVICGGFPCQPVSEAGRKQAEQDARWLWPEFARAIRAIRPRYALVENVPGLIVRGMGTVLRDLAALGYDAEWQMLPAAAFGAPHRRNRIFIVAYPASVGRDQGQVFGGINTQSVNQTSSRWWSGRYTNGRNGRVFSVPEFEFLQVDNGLPRRVDRRYSLFGNAIVPQVAEFVGQCVVRHATQQSFAADVLSPRESQAGSEIAHG